MARKEVEAITKLIPLNSERSAMIGILVSFKTLNGAQNKRPNRYPKVEKISKIFPNHPNVLNLVHYHTKEFDSLFEQLARITELSGHNFHGFQLNLAWPKPYLLKTYRSIFPKMKIVLQISNSALKEVFHSPQWLAAKIEEEYADVIDYLLLDLSRGTGSPLNPDTMYEYLTKLGERGFNLGLGIAGGLGANSLNRIKPLVKEFPNLCIDAESGLRNRNDHLDIELAGKYLLDSFKMFNNIKKERAIQMNEFTELVLGEATDDEIEKAFLDLEITSEQDIHDAIELLRKNRPKVLSAFSSKFWIQQSIPRIISNK